MPLLSGLPADKPLDDASLPPCPALPMRVYAANVNLAPGFVEHQSWVEFRVPREFAGWFAFCLDGRQFDTGGGELDFHTGVARFNLQTRAVDLEWLTGRLDGLRELDRWELRLRCDPEFVCQ